MSVATLTRQQPRRTIRSVFPILVWLPEYKSSYLRMDLVAAVTVWALLVPEAMAYAGIAGMPPETGLYGVTLALVGYAILGTSRHLHVGPSSTVAALSLGVVSGFAAVGSDEFIARSIVLAILVGVLLVVAGLLRMGVLADFISRPVLDGFVVGVAITIVVGQLDKLVRFDPEQADFVPEVLALVRNIDSLHVPSLAVGAVALALLFVVHRFAPRVPAALAVVVLGIMVSKALDFEAMGIHLVGDIPAGLPDYGLPRTASVSMVLSMLPGAGAIALVAFAESIAVARSYAAKANYRVDANQELLALGAANAGAGISGAFVVDGSMSRTSAAAGAGATTQMTSLIIAGGVLVTAAFLTPLFYYLPEAVLAAIVIHAVWHLIRLRPIMRYKSITRLDFLTALVAAVGVLVLGILQGIMVAVLLGLVGLLVGAKSKATEVLGREPGGTDFRSLANYPGGETYPGLLIVRYDGSLFFANAPDFADEIRAGIALVEPRPQVVLVDAEPINGIDATSAMAIQELQQELLRDGVELRFARVKTRVMEVMRRAGIDEIFAPEHFYATVQQGVDDYLNHRRPG